MSDCVPPNVSLASDGSPGLRVRAGVQRDRLQSQDATDSRRERLAAGCPGRGHTRQWLSRFCRLGRGNARVHHSQCGRANTIGAVVGRPSWQRGAVAAAGRRLRVRAYLAGRHARGTGRSRNQSGHLGLGRQTAQPDQADQRSRRRDVARLEPQRPSVLRFTTRREFRRLLASA